MASVGLTVPCTVVEERHHANGSLMKRTTKSGANLRGTCSALARAGAGQAQSSWTRSALYLTDTAPGEYDDGLAVLAIEHKGRTDRIVVRTGHCHGQSQTQPALNCARCCPMPRSPDRRERGGAPPLRQDGQGDREPPQVPHQPAHLARAAQASTMTTDSPGWFGCGMLSGFCIHVGRRARTAHHLDCPAAAKLPRLDVRYAAGGPRPPCTFKLNGPPNVAQTAETSRSEWSLGTTSDSGSNGGPAQVPGIASRANNAGATSFWHQLITALIAGSLTIALQQPRSSAQARTSVRTHRASAPAATAIRLRRRWRPRRTASAPSSGAWSTLCWPARASSSPAMPAPASRYGLQPGH